MIWKILTSLFGLGVIALLVFWYVPDLRKTWRQKDDNIQALTAAVTDLKSQFLSEKTQRQKLQATIDKTLTEQQLQAARWNSVLPTIRLDVQSLSPIQKQLSVLDNLVRNKFLVSPLGSDIVTDPTIIYTDDGTAAILTGLRYGDSLRVSDSTARLALSITKINLGYTRDTLSRFRSWADRGVEIASQKGLFTGRNRRLRKHVRNVSE